MRILTTAVRLQHWAKTVMHEERGCQNSIEIFCKYSFLIETKEADSTL